MRTRAVAELATRFFKELKTEIQNWNLCHSGPWQCLWRWQRAVWSLQLWTHLLKLQQVLDDDDDDNIDDDEHVWQALYAINMQPFFVLMLLFKVCLQVHRMFLPRLSLFWRRRLHLSSWLVALNQSVSPKVRRRTCVALNPEVQTIAGPIAWKESGGGELVYSDSGWQSKDISHEGRLQLIRRLPALAFETYPSQSHTSRGLQEGDTPLVSWCRPS